MTEGEKSDRSIANSFPPDLMRFLCERTLQINSDFHEAKQVKR